VNPLIQGKNIFEQLSLFTVLQRIEWHYIKIRFEALRKKKNRNLKFYRKKRAFSLSLSLSFKF